VNLFQRGATWYADYLDANGKRQRPSLKTTDRAEALRKLADLMQGTGAPLAPGCGMTVGQALDRAWEEHWSLLRDRNKLILIGAVKSTLGEQTPLASLNRNALEAYKRKLLAEGKAGSTVNRYVNVVTHVLRRASERWGLDVPVPRVDRCDERGGERLRYLDDSEIEALLAAERDPEWALLWRFLLESGARLSDALSTTWKAFDWRNGLWYCQNSKIRKPMNLPLDMRLMEELKELKDSGRFRPFVFTARAAGAHFTRVRDRAGLSSDVTIHVLRHTCATKLLADGADIREVQEWLGHLNITTTQRYAKVIPQSLMRLREKRSLRLMV
jgi:integrase